MKKSRFTTEQIIGFIKQTDLKRLLAEAHLDIEALKIGFHPRNSLPTTGHKPPTMQSPSTPGFISNHWYGQWGQVSDTNTLRL